MRDHPMLKVLSTPPVHGTIDDLVARLWSLCHIMRDDGVAYHQYVTELSYLLFLKMSKEIGADAYLPKNCRWTDIVAAAPRDQLRTYRNILHAIASRGRGRVKPIFEGASTMMRNPQIFLKLVSELDAIDWYEARREGLGELYEGLLSRNVAEKKSGAGQYFTPRPLIEAIVAVTRPTADEVVQDPAAGTGGFLIVADQYRKSQRSRGNVAPLRAMELVRETHRLLLMNAALHDLAGDFWLGDALSEDAKRLGKADVILTNPPFGTKRGGALPQRADLPFPISNKQFAFLQHVFISLNAPTLSHVSRAAVIVPDNVLFENGLSAKIRRELVETCDLHTILRLPTGIFYAHGVKTNVLFFTKNSRKPNRHRRGDLWVYDLRSGIPPFGKSRPLQRAHFDEFVTLFGTDPLGRQARSEHESFRFRRFNHQCITERGYNLDISWTSGDAATSAGSLEELTQAITSMLHAALEDITSIAASIRNQQ